MKRLILAAVLAAAFAFLGRGWGPDASASPIACPGAQTAVHTSDGGWFCENPAGHENASERPKH